MRYTNVFSLYGIKNFREFTFVIKKNFMFIDINLYKINPATTIPLIPG